MYVCVWDCTREKYGVAGGMLFVLHIPSGLHARHLAIVEHDMIWGVLYGRFRVQPQGVKYLVVAINEDTPCLVGARLANTKT